MWQLGWVAANDGNVSVKLPDGNFMVTPTGISKSFITPEKLIIIDKDINIVSAEGNYKPSSEIKMHMRCYTERDVVLLENHGALTVGCDLITAYYRMETLELFAKISLTAELLGGAKEIEKPQIDKLLYLRESYYGVTGKHPGYKHYDNQLKL